ncbi:hypothetical protein NC653_017179 [Populus alba x Populus x berolinensis]|uniref:Uncharacterized protein n=1 Tax=Populus alba x Populus x berolinensis TaxID=444605 RepID=A0AAD6QPT3_9ROSI|nr:hypothetical protein NC653_017179 [Populus alba x Populus x berolinensis]
MVVKNPLRLETRVVKNRLRWQKLVVRNPLGKQSWKIKLAVKNPLRP